jgi:hypothetical protein
MCYPTAIRTPTVNFPPGNLWPVSGKPAFLPERHPIYPKAPSVNPWCRGRAIFQNASSARQAGLLDGRAVGGSYLCCPESLHML